MLQIYKLLSRERSELCAGMDYIVRLFWFFSDEAPAQRKPSDDRIIRLIKESALMCLLDLSVFSGELLHRATEMERTAGLTHSLSEKWIRGKMHTPTCWPKMRKATCTKFSVSRLKSSFQVPNIRRFSNKRLISVHNVKPECLDAYNKLWWVLLISFIPLESW